MDRIMQSDNADVIMIMDSATKNQFCLLNPFLVCAAMCNGFKTCLYAKCMMDLQSSYTVTINLNLVKYASRQSFQDVH